MCQGQASSVAQVVLLCGLELLGKVSRGGAQGRGLLLGRHHMVPRPETRTGLSAGESAGFCCFSS